MSSSGKKKGGAKDRVGAEEVASVASVQSAFTSAARETAWYPDVSPAAATSGSGRVSPPPAAVTGAPRIFTAASNALCGRPFGATRLEDPWAHAEAIPHVSGEEKVLPGSRHWAAERSAYARLFLHPPHHTTDHGGSAELADASRTGSLKVEGGEAVAGDTDTLYEEWLAHVAAHRGSPQLYPHHTLHFTAPVALTTAADANAYRVIAATLHRLLTVYLERCSEQEVEGRSPTVPSRVFASMLYTSVYNNNFSGPPAEEKDVAFSAFPATSHEEKNKRRRPARRYDAMSVISSLGVSHVCVCVGKRYYRVDVVETRTGQLRSVAAIASSLEAVVQHHDSMQRHADPLAGASPAVLQDRDAMETMFSHLSQVADGAAFEVRRRLREASAVNACSLDALQDAICAVVLRTGSAAAAEPTARWLHSVCSLEVSLESPQRWVMRLLAAVVPSHAGVEWITRAATSTTTTHHRDADGAAAVGVVAAGPTETAENAAPTAAALHKLSVAALSTPVDDDGHTAYLELWLPEKHRVPLRPYPTPPWDSETTQCAVADLASGSSGCTLEHLVLTLLQVVVEASHNRQFSPATSAARRWPKVMLAVSPLSGGAPTLADVNTPAILHYYEVLSAPPLLFAAATRRAVAAAAMAEVQALLNIVAHARTTTQMAPPPQTSSWWPALTEQAADVCVSFVVLPRSPSTAGTAATPPVQRVVSDLAVPCSVLVNVTAVQVAAEPDLRASAAIVTDAVVQAYTQAAVDVSRSIGRALASCKQM